VDGQFRDKLEALGLKRDRLCFHSFRHTVAGRLEAAAVSQTDAARVLGHTIAGIGLGGGLEPRLDLKGT
jgi:integrase